MTINHPDTHQRLDAPSNRAALNLRFHERLVVSVLIAALNTWIRAVEVLTANHHHARFTRDRRSR